MACVPSLGASADQVINRISTNVNATRSSRLTDPHVKTLLSIALDSQSKTIVWVLLLSGISFLFSLLFLLLLQLDLKKVQRKLNADRKIMVLRHLMLSFVWTSTALAFGASLATSQLAKVLQHTSNVAISVVAPSITIQGGSGLQALQWLVFALSVFFSTGVSLIFPQVQGGRSMNKEMPSFQDVHDVPDF